KSGVSCAKPLDKRCDPTTNKSHAVSLPPHERTESLAADSDMSSILQKVAPIGEAREREMLKDASTYVYHRSPQGDVQAHVFRPARPSAAPAPVVVFFHGGFWDSPMPTQFVPHCLHFAGRGAVAVAAETRTASKHG